MISNNHIKRIYDKYCENKLSHTYLIETNNLDKCLNDIKELIKLLNCPEEYKEGCTKCNLCNLINKSNLPSLKLIEPDGTSIKKNQIEELKLAFETKPIYSKYNVYIITNAEKLNASSANAMLKFVEEPTEGIIGFFLTSNKDLVIETIKSRCQIVLASYPSDSIDELNISKETYNDYLSIIKSYLEAIDSADIVNNKELILNKISERSNIIILFKLMLILFYQKYLESIKADYNQELVKIMKENTLTSSQILSKITIISDILQNMSYNVNIELLLDKFVIEMRGSNG